MSSQPSPPGALAEPWPHPDFTTEFLGTGNQPESEAAEGTLAIAGQTVAYGGPVRGRATVIVRASGIRLEAPNADQSILIY